MYYEDNPWCLSDEEIYDKEEREWFDEDYWNAEYERERRAGL